MTSVRPRVLLVGPDLCGGGGERHFANLSRHLFQGTCDVSVLRNSLGNYQVLNSRQQFSVLGWSSRFSYPRIINRLRRLLNSSEYDCCVGFGLFPSIVLYFAVKSTYYNPTLISMEITRPVESMKQAVTWRRILYTQLRRITYHDSDIFLANSLDGVLESVEKLGIDKHKALRGPNIIEDKKIHNEKGSLNPYATKCPYIICVSRLVKLKRLDDVLHAFARSSIPLTIGLMILGDGPMKEYLMSLSTKLGIRERVTFTGYVTNPFPIIYESSGFVLASEYEGFSNSVLEAMFCDVPVITSFCSADSREMCAQGAALGFEVGDHKHLAEHIVSVVTDDALKQELVKHARQYRDPHTLENAIPFYENLIRKAAKRGH